MKNEKPRSKDLGFLIFGPRWVLRFEPDELSARKDLAVWEPFVDDFCEGAVLFYFFKALFPLLHDWVRGSF